MRIMEVALARMTGTPCRSVISASRAGRLTEIGMFRIADGKIKEAWYYGDELGLMLQLGIVNAVVS